MLTLSISIRKFDFSNQWVLSMSIEYYQKKPFVENDVVLVYIDNKPAFFSRVEGIAADVKKGWWQVTFLLLNIPLNTFTWILDNDQIRGADFTMQGTPMRIEKVVAPQNTKSDPPDEDDPDEPQGDSGRILSMRKKP